MTRISSFLSTAAGFSKKIFRAVLSPETRETSANAAERTGVRDVRLCASEATKCTSPFLRSIAAKLLAWSPKPPVMLIAVT